MAQLDRTPELATPYICYSRTRKLNYLCFGFRTSLTPLATTDHRISIQRANHLTHSLTWVVHPPFLIQHSFPRLSRAGVGELSLIASNTKAAHDLGHSVVVIVVVVFQVDESGFVLVLVIGEMALIFSLTVTMTNFLNR